MPQVYRFDDPTEDPRLKQFFASFGINISMQKSIEEGKPWGLFYWPQRSDKEEMVFEYHRRMNPSTYIVNIHQIFRVFDQRDKKEYLYWYGTKQVRTPAPAETIPGREFICSNYFDRHCKPVVDFDGTDYYGKPVNVRLKDTEIAYDIPWSQDAFKGLVNDPAVKFSNYELCVGIAATSYTKGPPSPMYQIKEVKDFLEADFDELLDFGKNNFDSIEQYRITKDLQAKERQAWISGNKITTTEAAINNLVTKEGEKIERSKSIKTQAS